MIMVYNEDSIKRMNVRNDSINNAVICGSSISEQNCCINVQDNNKVKELYITLDNGQEYCLVLSEEQVNYLIKKFS